MYRRHTGHTGRAVTRWDPATQTRPSLAERTLAQRRSGAADAGAATPSDEAAYPSPAQDKYELIGGFARLLSFKRPLLSVDVSACVCLSTTLMLNISETKRFTGSCPIGTVQESAYGASIGDVIDDVT